MTNRNSHRWSTITPIAIALTAVVISSIGLYFQYGKPPRTELFINIANYQTYRKGPETEAIANFEIIGNATIHIANTGETPIIMSKVATDFVWDEKRDSGGSTHKSPTCQRFEQLSLRPGAVEELKIECTGMWERIARPNMSRVHFYFHAVDVFSGAEAVANYSSEIVVSPGTASLAFGGGTGTWVRLSEWQPVHANQKGDDWSVTYPQRN